MQNGNLKSRISIALLVMFFCTLFFAEVSHATEIPEPTGTEYFVAITGSDTTGNGSSGNPWRTIQYAANHVTAPAIITVRPGRYEEYVQLNTVGGSGSNYITLRAQYGALDPGTTEAMQSSVQGFRIQKNNIRIEGFVITLYKASGYCYPSVGQIMIERNGAGAIIKDNWIKDAIYMVSDNFTYSASAQTISNPATEKSFIEAGFTPGESIWIARSLTDVYNECSLVEGKIVHSKNHDHVYRIKTVEDHKITIDTDPASCYPHTVTPLVDEGPAHSVIYASRGNSYNGIRAIYMNVESTYPYKADNCIIIGNKISGSMGGPVVFLAGTNTLFEGNEISDFHAFGAFWFWGTDMIVQYNYFHDNKRLPRLRAYLPSEDPNNICSPYWDFYDSFYTSYGYPNGSANISVSNNVFQYNVLKDLDLQFGQVYWCSNSGAAVDNKGFIYRYNVVSGMEMHGSFHRPKSYIYGNTFYKAGTDGSSHLVLVDDEQTCGSNATGSVIENNVFVECGQMPDTAGSRGWYFVGTQMARDPDYNYVAGAVSENYPAKAGFAGDEVHGINGGDPQFKNVDDLLGADGLPYTSDDGLSLQSSSILVDKGGFMTRVTSANGTGNTLTLEDAYYFSDGNDYVEGDLIQLENSSQRARITNVNHTTNTITLDQDLTWTQGQGVSFPYEGARPDIGAYEYAGSIQNCSSLGGSCCSSDQSCSGGSFQSSSDCAKCCVSGACQTCLHKSDLPPCDSCVSQPELMAFINLWYLDSSDPTIKELIEAIGLWKRGGC